MVRQRAGLFGGLAVVGLPAWSKACTAKTFDPSLPSVTPLTEKLSEVCAALRE